MTSAPTVPPISMERLAVITEHPYVAMLEDIPGLISLISSLQRQGEWRPEGWVHLPRIGGIAARISFDEAGALLLERRDDREGIWSRPERIRLPAPPQEQGKDVAPQAAGEQ